jgi:hypothetical protein
VPLREQPRSWLPVLAAGVMTSFALAVVGAVSRPTMYVVSGVLFVVLGAIFSAMVAKEIRRSR